MEKGFEEFKNSCLEDISELQDEFKRIYSIDDYPEWFYDHDLGIFTFKSESNNLYFKYIYVGSFSRKGQSWLWAWGNDDISLHVKKSLEKVKEFGNQNNFPELTTGYSEGDEYTGWEMTSISAKLLKGIGVYRVVVDELEIYFIFLKEVSQDQFDDIKENKILCDCHGPGKPSFICQHLNKREVTGFHEAFPSDPDDLFEEEDFQAWCNACEEVWQQEGEWNENSMEFAKIKLVCDQCYFEIKELNLGFRKG